MTTQMEFKNKKWGLGLLVCKVICKRCVGLKHDAHRCSQYKCEQLCWECSGHCYGDSLGSELNQKQRAVLSFVKIFLKMFGVAGKKDEDLYVLCWRQTDFHLEHSFFHHLELNPAVLFAQLACRGQQSKCHGRDAGISH